MRIPPGEKIIETKKCRLSGQEFFVTDRDRDFLEKVSPIFNGKKYQIPSPTLCPEERMRNIQSFVNQRHLYIRKSDLSEIELVSNFSPSARCPVYSVSEWYGEKWDPKSISAPISFDRKIFEQCRELFDRVPHWSLSQGNNNENCDFSNHGQGNNSCYLLVTGSHNTRVHYGVFMYNSSDCIDCDFSKESELCFDSVDVQKCYKVFWSGNCSDCRDSIGLLGCQNCQYCFGCWNLKGKKFCILNEQVSEEKYKNDIQKFLSLSLAEQKRIIQNVQKMATISYYSNIHGYSNEGVSGDYIYNSSHAWNSFEAKNTQDIKNCVAADGVKSTHDCLMSRNSEWNYYCSLVSAHSSHVALSSAVMGSRNVYYSDSCVNITDCFACSGLHSHGHHCILNKPYSIQEYETLAGSLVDHMRSTGEWGEFFPHELSPFGYNETVAQEYFPMSESEVRAKGWNWHNETEKSYVGEIFTPLTISEYDERIVGYETAQKNIESLLSSTLRCQITGRPFKIIKQELLFYIENGLQIPTKHPDQRHKERMEMRNPRTLWERTCDECGKDVTTTYSPDRPEKVVCEECYRKLVY